ncbi:MAG TPA: hypothetical protein VLX31_04005 [Streptosporangiaceae bacterium]|nr:hypothetical protein [Streptosporangiaceae bacterium]
MDHFREEREKIARGLAEARGQEARLAAEVARLTVGLTHVRAKIASLEAQDRVYSQPGIGQPPRPAAGDLSRMTIREAILAVLSEARPEFVRTRDLEQRMADRGKKVAGGVSVDLTSLKQSGEAVNPAWGYWTVP